MCLFKKKKTEPSITMEGETAIFNDGCGRIVRATPDQLKAIYEVYAGDWPFQVFFVIEFDRVLVVAPLETVFMHGFLSAWKREILDKQKGFEAVCWYAPFKYCKRTYGFLPTYDIKLTITKPKRTMMKPKRLRNFRMWEISGPISAHNFS